MRNLAQRILERRRDLSLQRQCSFCGRGEGRVGRLIAGPDVHICDECVEFCNEILEKERSQGRV